MIVAKHDQAITEFIEDRKIVKSIYKGRYNQGSAIEHIDIVIDFYDRNEVKGSIIDIRKGYGSFSNLFEYLAKNYYPVAIKSGLLAQAYIVSDDLINSALGERLGILSSKHKIKSQIFSDLSEGEAWVLSQLKEASIST